MQAWIHITGTQQVDEQEPDTVELTTSGRFSPVDGGWELQYSESEATGMDGTVTTLHILGDRIVLERTSSHAGMLVLERHRRHHSHYATPYGALDLGTYATELHWALSETGGTLDFAYTLGFNGSVNSTHAVHITVQEEKTSCPRS